MRKITLLIALIGMAITASAQNWTSFNSYGFQRKINGTDTVYRVLGAGVNTPYLYLRSDWSMKQLLDGKANLVGGNTFTGGGQIIQDSQPTVELKSTLFNQSFKLGYFDAVGNFEIRNHQNKKLLQLTNPISSSAQPSLGIGNFTGSIPGESQLYVYGGANGANIDARGRSERDEANIDLEGSDWATTPNSLGFSYFGINNTTPIANTLGYIAKKLAMIRFNEANSALIVSNKTDSIVPIRFGINNSEIANISDKGWSYQSDFTSVNSSNPRWMPDKAYVDGLVANKANTDASNINVANYKTALNVSDGSTLNNNISGSAEKFAGYGYEGIVGSMSYVLGFNAMTNNIGVATDNQLKLFLGLPSTGGYDLQSVTNRGSSTTNGANFGGNVGIGTTSPSAKLDVNGSIRASGNDGNANSVVRNSDLGNYVTTNTSQTGLGGDKTWTGSHTFQQSVNFVGKITADKISGTGAGSPLFITDASGTESIAQFQTGNVTIYKQLNQNAPAFFNNTVTVPLTPTANTHAASKGYADGASREEFLNVSTNLTITDASFVNSKNLAVYVDASTAAVTITLPAVANATGKKILIFKTDSSANSVSIFGPGGLIYINGSPTYTLTSQYASVEIHANSTQYYAK